MGEQGGLNIDPAQPIHLFGNCAFSDYHSNLLKRRDMSSCWKMILHVLQAMGKRNFF